MLRLRIITAALGVPVVIAAIWCGHPWFGIFLSAVTLTGVFEFYRVAGLNPKHPLIYLGLVWALALLWNAHYPGTKTMPMVTAGIMLTSLILLLSYSPRERAFRDWTWVVAGALYVGWMLSHWLDLRALPQGRELVLLAMLATFANDTAAFFIGRKTGKRKLAPTISPTKTWEGAIGGAIGAISGALLIAKILDLLFTFAFNYWQILILGFIISVFAQLGDLAESLFKRNMKVKESGALLPGHGGVLDRFDSVIFVGVAVYYYLIACPL